jgi:tetratricopeptide (TPR) repeat protein
VCVHVSGKLSEADRDAFAALANSAPLELSHSPADAADGRLDEFTEAVAADQGWIADRFAEDGDWVQLRRRLRRYVMAGDMWTTAWLAESAMNIHPIPPTPEAGDLLGLAYQMLEQPARAEFFYRRAYRAGGLLGARAAYSLAMLYVRHHPSALRDLDHAERLLDAAAEILAEARVTDDADVDYALNRNGKSLVLFRRGHTAEAADLLRTTVDALGDSEQEGMAKAILLYNLGRVEVKRGRVDAGIAFMEKAVSLDPDAPEYWLELARAQITAGRYAAAEESAESAERNGDHLPGPSVIRGFLAAQAGRHNDAAGYFAHAATVSPARYDLLLSAAREFSLTGDYELVRRWHGRIPPDALDGEDRAELEILALEACSHLDGLDEAEVRVRLGHLAERYPESDLIARNLSALTG